MTGLPELAVGGAAIGRKTGMLECPRLPECGEQ